MLYFVSLYWGTNPPDPLRRYAPKSFEADMAGFFVRAKGRHFV